MNGPRNPLARFFGVVIRGQTYLNLLYLLLAFPLGLTYFILLVVGFSLGFALLIVLVGALILVGMFAVWWACAILERQLAIWLLREDIPPMTRPNTAGQDFGKQIQAHLSNPVTWKSLLYLFAKFPLGIFTFVVGTVLLALTLAFLVAPVAMPFFPLRVEFWDGVVWVADTIGEAILAFFIGVALLFPTLHILNALAWVSGRFAWFMLGNPPARASQLPTAQPHPTPESPQGA